MIVNPTNPFDRERADAYYRKLMSGTDPFELTKKSRKRTLSQNALFHVWCQVLADHLGYVSLEECKSDVKRNLLGMRERVDHFTGEVVKDDYHTSGMSTKELSDLMDRMKIWAQTEFGCYLPYWKEPGYEEMMEQYKNK